MSHATPKDYGIAMSDAQGRPLKVVRALCGCCGENTRANVWSLFGHGNVRCGFCREKNCGIISKKRRCGRPDPGPILYGSRA